MIAALALLIAAPTDPVGGVWEGRSLCQVKPSPCHDEHVIYRIERTSAQRYRIDAYKLVAGQEQFMGAINVVFTPGGGLLGGAVVSGGRTMGQLQLTLHDSRLSGRMMLNDGTVYRLIDVAKR